MDQRRTSNPAARPSEIEEAARELMAAIYDVSHGHIHFDYVDSERASMAARRLARALHLVEEE